LLIAVVAFSRFAKSMCVTENSELITSRTIRLLDRHGKAISGASVKVHDPSGLLVFSTNSNGEGLFSIPKLKKQSCRVTINGDRIITYQYHFTPSRHSEKIKSLSPQSQSECHDMSGADWPTPLN
jgi:hypothetical protein